MRIVYFQAPSNKEMKVFVYPHPEDEKKIAVASLIDDNIDPFKEIHKDGFYHSCEGLSSEWFECYEIDMGNKRLEINISKAHEQTRKRLRAERVPLLQKLDIEFQRALEEGRPFSEITRRKKALRDITLLVSSCKTIQELSALKCQ